MKKNLQKSAAQEEKSIASQPTSKKIGFFSAMLIAMGSSIGAGIFFKAQAVLNYSHGSFIFAILSWLIAAFTVISMALALVEIASARNDNLSLIGWCKVFNSRTIYKASKNFMFYIYLPLTYFFMPLYVLLSFQDAMEAFTNDSWKTFGTSGDWAIWTIISILISLFFIFVSGMSSKAGDIMNKVIMSVKFLPLAATIILGFVIAGMTGEWNMSPTSVLPGNDQGISSTVNPMQLEFMTPGIGLFMAMGAIFFAYDGFYVTAGLQTEMKEPKKTPLAIVLGLGVVTVIYLLIAISMSIGGDGGLFGFRGFLASKGALWVFGLLNLTIAIGVMGIINGFAMWAPRFVQDLIKEKELPFSNKFIDKISDDKKPMIGIYYSLAITLPLILLFTIIGSQAYINTYGNSYGEGMGSLYTFSDLLGTWTAVFAFMFIMLPIFGGIKNRKTQIAKTEQKKYFLPCAWASVIIIGIVLLLLFLDAFVNVFMLINLSDKGYADSMAAYKLTYTDLAGNADQTITLSVEQLEWAEKQKGGIEGFIGALRITAHERKSNYEYWYGGNDGVIGRVMKLVTLFIFLGLMFLPTVIEDKINMKKFGKIDPELNVQA